MRAAVLNAPNGVLDFEDIAMDTLLPREVRVRTVAVGLCHSDLHYLDGVFDTELPEILGHEVAGVVEEVGSEVTSMAPGDHVVACASIFCGSCRYCTDGHQTLCVNHQRLRHRPQPKLTNRTGAAVGTFGGIGGFAEQVIAHENGLVPVGQDIPLELACLLGCSVVTGVGSVVRAAKVRPGSSVAVLGCGGVGVAVIQGARLAGAASIIAIDLSDRALAQARRFGATETINSGEHDPVTTVQELTRGGADYTFEAVGRRATCEQAVAMLAPGGTATVLGMVSDGDLRIPASELYFREKKIQGSLFGSNQFKTDIPGFVELHRQGRLSLEDMVTERIPFEAINEGFEIMRRGAATRVVAMVGASA